MKKQILFIVVQIYSFVSYSQTLVLDVGFSTDGKLLYDEAAADHLSELKLLDDGAPLLIGNYYSGGNLKMYIAKFTTSGELDLSFADEGRLQYLMEIEDAYYSYIYPIDIALDSNQKILIAGWYQFYDGYFVSDPEFIFLKYNFDGSPDSSFLDFGIGTIPFWNDHITRPQLLLRGDDKFNLVISDWEGFYSFRFEENGFLDTGFGDEGIVEIVEGNVYNPKAAIFNDNSFLVGSNSGIFKMKEDGTFDFAFGIDGFTEINSPLPEFSISVQKIIITTESKIIGCGSLNKNEAGFEQQYPFVFRILSNGILDESFGTGGYFYIDTLDANAEYIDIAERDDSRFYVGGNYKDESGDLLITIINEDGKLNSALHTQVIDLGELELLKTIILDEDQSLFLSGESNHDDYGDAFILKYLPFDAEEEILSINDHENQIKIYPNPSKDVIEIKGIQEGNYNYVIYSMDGKMIQEEQNFKSDIIYKINIQTIPPGLYILEMKNADFVLEKQFIKF